MTWVRLDDTAPMHPKLLKLSDGALRLWIHGLAFANRSVTDGKIDKTLVASLNHHGRWSPKQLASFVAELAGVLWIDCGDHYEIHDYTHHQAEAMKDRVERKRELDRVRQQKKREREDDKARESLGMSRRDMWRDNQRESRRETSVPSRPVPTRPESATHSSAGAPDSEPQSSSPKPRWLSAMEAPDATTVDCLRAFDAGYASVARNGKPLGVSAKHGDVLEQVASAREMCPEDPASLFREAGAEIARRVIASMTSETKIRNPWLVFTSAPLGTFLGQSETAKAPEVVTGDNDAMERFEAAKRLLEATTDLDAKRAARREYDAAQMALALSRVRSGAA